MKKIFLLFLLSFVFYSCQTIDSSELASMDPITIFAIADRYKNRRKYTKAKEYYEYVKDNFDETQYPIEHLEADYNIGLIMEKKLKKKEAIKYYHQIIDRTDEFDLPKSFKILSEKRIERLENKKNSMKTNSEDESLLEEDLDSLQEDTPLVEEESESKINEEEIDMINTEEKNEFKTEEDELNKQEEILEENVEEE